MKDDETTDERTEDRQDGLEALADLLEKASGAGLTWFPIGDEVRRWTDRLVSGGVGNAPEAQTKSLLEQIQSDLQAKNAGVRSLVDLFQSDHEARTADIKAMVDKLQRNLDATKAGYRSLTEEFQHINESINRLYELEPHKKMAVRYGWPPIMDISLDYFADTFGEAEKLESEDERRAYVDERFVAYYRGDNLEQLFARWRSAGCLKDTKRLSIISDAFEAYKDGRFSVASPAILAQTEGLFADEFRGERETPGITSAYDDGSEKLSGRLDDESVIAIYLEALQSFVLQYGLSSKENTEDSLAYHVNRHKVLHGSSTEYVDSEPLALRHLLWLSGIVEICELMRTPEPG